MAFEEFWEQNVQGQGTATTVNRQSRAAASLLAQLAQSKGVRVAPHLRSQVSKLNPFMQQQFLTDAQQAQQAAAGGTFQALGQTELLTGEQQAFAGGIGQQIAGLGAGFADIGGQATFTPGQQARQEELISREAAVAAGGQDTRFADFEAAQQAALGQEFERRGTQQASFFARRGGAGTAAELQAQQQLGQERGVREQQLSSQLGMQQLSRQDQATMRTAQLQAQQSGLTAQSQQAQMAALGGQQAALAGGLGATAQFGQLGAQQAAVQQAAAAGGTQAAAQAANIAQAQSGFQRQSIGQQAALQTQGFQNVLQSAQARSGLIQDAFTAGSVPEQMRIARIAATTGGGASGVEFGESEPSQFSNFLGSGGGGALGAIAQQYWI